MHYREQRENDLISKQPKVFDDQKSITVEAVVEKKLPSNSDHGGQGCEREVLGQNNEDT